MADKLIQTKQQKRAQAAHRCISSISEKGDDGYIQLAKKFPALVHTCGLAQATAFVQAKEEKVGKIYLAHLSKVMGLEENTELGERSRDSNLIEYQRLSFEAIESATWLKRYTEALLES
ncbi:MAG: type III-B CRISPR module-associated protein Cmr5 [Methanotrichaceae archaeon]